MPLMECLGRKLRHACTRHLLSAAGRVYLTNSRQTDWDDPPEGEARLALRYLGCARQGRGRPRPYGYPVVSLAASLTSMGTAGPIVEAR
jgi:hypothetical protein